MAQDLGGAAHAVIALLLLGPDIEDADGGPCQAEDYMGEGLAHHREIHQLFVTGPDIGAHVQYDALAFEGGPNHGDGRARNTLNDAQPEHGDRHQRAGVAGADRDIGLALLHAIDGMPHRRVLAPAQNMAGLVLHRHPARRMAHMRTALEFGMAGDKRIQLRLVAMQKKLDVGMTLKSLEQRAHDNGRAGITAHGIYRDGQGAGHGHLSRGGFSSSPSRLRARHNGRRNRRYDAAAWARRSWGSHHGRQPSKHDASGAYCGATARFFVSGPPWRKTPKSPPPRIIGGGRKQAAWVAGKPGSFQAKSRVNEGVKAPISGLSARQRDFPAARKAGFGG